MSIMLNLCVVIYSYGDLSSINYLTKKGWWMYSIIFMRGDKYVVLRSFEK